MTWCKFPEGTLQERQALAVHRMAARFLLWVQPPPQDAIEGEQSVFLPR
jgi:hypothetical protein